ncbi:hypothetical protein NPIL_233171 [Nephila pilipes]|uniref:Uncharacterized protein n=1 Tax=Nephila pilipes TaxID=299642 RepID=A0A8X6Q4F8_NEPPI|nr:hypothetical protein NPIL_233171 [Nephila pilipes]
MLEQSRQAFLFRWFCTTKFLRWCQTRTCILLKTDPHFWSRSNDHSGYSAIKDRFMLLNINPPSSPWPFVPTKEFGRKN